MKSLKEYMILEMSLFTKDEMTDIWGKATRQVAEFVTYFEKFLNKIKKEYSIVNKQHVGYLWNIFKKEVSSMVKSNTLREFNCDTPENLGRLLGNNADLINKKLGKEYIKTNLTKTEREYRNWKDTDEYVPLSDYDKNDPYEDDEELGRAWCIYCNFDPGDTSLVKVFRMNGKTTDKNVMHEINMHKVDWKYETGLKYFDANPCLVEHYRSTDKESLRQEVDYLYDE